MAGKFKAAKRAVGAAAAFIPVAQRAWDTLNEKGPRRVYPLSIPMLMPNSASGTISLELGARAVMIGRAYLWGLGANGQAGVENVLDILSGGIDSALRAGAERAAINGALQLYLDFINMFLFMLRLFGGSRD